MEYFSVVKIYKIRRKKVGIRKKIILTEVTKQPSHRKKEMSKGVQLGKGRWEEH